MGQDRPEYAHCQQLAEDVANLLAPQSGAYYDVWLDGEKFFSAEMEVGRMPLLHHLTPPGVKGIPSRFVAELPALQGCSCTAVPTGGCVGLGKPNGHSGWGWKVIRHGACMRWKGLRVPHVQSCVAQPDRVVVCVAWWEQNPKVTEDRAFNGFGTNFEGSPEPIYGSVFLPRKFKVRCWRASLLIAQVRAAPSPCMAASAFAANGSCTAHWQCS